MWRNDIATIYIHTYIAPTNHRIPILRKFFTTMRVSSQTPSFFISTIHNICPEFAEAITIFAHHKTKITWKNIFL